ncbi:uncharacterized protein YrzB (UPF0473 family) [Anaerotaenia torta]|uniref:DUF1292 domain-containing protein n=1 Tax=Anaerotaenia torta TaxID=433293 RepID=UPI003D20449B
MGEHIHGDGCGCGHEHEHDSITLSLDDGTELNCIILEIFTVDDKEYIALQPEEGEEEEDNVFLYRFIQEGDDEPQLLNIDDDDEFEAVADAFEELLDAAEYDDMFDDDDEDDFDDLEDEEE